MLEQMKYINHLNEVIEFGKNGIFADANELRNYEWTAKNKGNKFDKFEAGICKRKLPVHIICDTVEKGIEARNRLFEVMEKDVLTKQYGRIVIGDYYLKCFVLKSQKKDYLTAQRYLQLELTVQSDVPFWYKETKHVFRKNAESGAGGKNLDYSFDYAFDFKPDTGNERLINRSLAASNFRITIYGICTNPEIKIGGHLYRVYGTVEANEYLTIDSVTKEIYLTTNTGRIVNRFNDRYRRSYIFEKIPTGIIPVLWEGGYGIDVTIIDERSEPDWT